MQRVENNFDAGCVCGMGGVVVPAPPEAAPELCPCWSAPGRLTYAALKGRGEAYAAAKVRFHAQPALAADDDEEAGSRGSSPSSNVFAAWGGVPHAFEEGLMLPSL